VELALRAERLLNGITNLLAERTTKMKRILVAMSFLAIAFSVISCASAPLPAPTAAPVALARPPAAPAQPPSLESGPKAGGATDSTANVPSAASADRMIVYTVNLRLEVQDTDRAVNDVTAIAAQFKGYVAATNLSRDPNGKMRGTVTLRIPADSLDAAQKQIEAAGLKVLSRNKNSNDVTDQYTDLNARLTNLTATEADLRKLMDSTTERTNKADDILAVYRELTNVRTQIEQIKGQMNVIEKTSTLATLTVEFVPHEDIQIVEPETWMPNQTAAEALRALVQALQGIINLAIWLVLFLLPVLIVLLLPFIILAMILRAIFRRRAKKSAAATL
jgi:hypothetical protein